jgi:chromate transporter
VQGRVFGSEPPRFSRRREKLGERKAISDAAMETVRTQEPEPPATPIRAVTLCALARLFLRLGLTAFGGPAAHIALMQQEVVERRKWLTQEAFLDRLGAANLLPGPSSTELAIYIGYLQAGWAGLLLAGVCFILPAFLLVLGMAWAYVRFGHLPQVAGALYGIKPVVIAVVLQALWNLGRAAVKTRWLAGLGLLATALALGRVSPLLILFGAGMLVAGGRWAAEKRKESFAPLFVLLLLVAFLALAPLLLGRSLAVSAAPGALPLFLVFLKLGAVVYGSGYVLLAFLQAELVTQRGWLTSAQLLDAVAVGQVTPGPVFTTATFIGYLLGGFKGAVLATLGMFLPAFLFVGMSGPLVSRLRQSRLAGAFLDGVNVAAVALMAAVTWQLGREALTDPVTVGLAAASALLLRFRVNSAWLLLGGAALGLAVKLAMR